MNPKKKMIPMNIVMRRSITKMTITSQVEPRI